MDRNYLRVRGEYNICSYQPGKMRELPPRARRIHNISIHDRVWYGTTSACAENTSAAKTDDSSFRNYLRVRGEYDPADHPDLDRLELPPRARRIRVHVGPGVTSVGTTSACAENTRHRHHRWHPGGNYLRVRGEYGRPEYVLTHSQELPPRARRIRNCVPSLSNAVGTTSACAENTRCLL